ncbi:MAG: alpha-hydroxy-acid oxidizing protein [Thermoplasmata archaeon]
MRENYGGFGTERQSAIYGAGATGKRPAIPLTAEGLERDAAKVLTPTAREYVAGSAGGGSTARANVAEFDRWLLVPRLMRDVRERDTRIELFGKLLPAPLLFAPLGALGIVHPEGELCVARASAATGVPMVASTLTSPSLEEIGTAMGSAHRWFQLYWGPDRDVDLSLVARAEQAGYSALVVTLDAPLLGWRPKDLEHGYLPFLGGVGLGNYLSDPVFRGKLPRPPEDDIAGAIESALSCLGDPAFSWNDLRFLSERTSLPIVVKGILHPQDAVEAMEAGANGLIVSNHGGRQLDGSVPALRALAEVATEVGQRVPVLFDSGIRRGTDVVKALALGAQAVLLGRPYAWGLALNGEDGVRQVAEDFLAEFDLSLALGGWTKLSEVGRDGLRPA